MRRVVEVLSPGDWPAAAMVAEVTLAFDARHRRRFRMVDENGEPFLLDLERPTFLGDGDGLVVDGGGIIRVRAASEAVADIRGRTPADTARLAWHIGNRHAAAQVLPDGTLRIRDDHVIVAMLEGLGGIVTRLHAPFSPEPGAYARAGSGPGHHHDP
jgi:urease accessory protein